MCPSAPPKADSTMAWTMCGQVHQGGFDHDKDHVFKPTQGGLDHDQKADATIRWPWCVRD